MIEFLTYSIKVAAVMAVFYLFYKILLAKETFHRINRIVLLLTALAPFVLPLCVITITRTVEASTTFFVEEPIVVATEAAQKSFDWSILLTVLYLIGVAGVVVWNVMGILSIRKLLQESRLIDSDHGEKVYITKQKITPFSWFNIVVLSEEDWAENGATILAHERAHHHLRHSTDLVLVNLGCAVQWFNPAIWLLRRDIMELHEFEADEVVLQGGVNAKEYQLLLIKKAVGNKSYSIANNLNHSTLKKRITMMLKKKSSAVSQAKVLYLLPLVCLSLGAFAQVVEVEADDKGKQNKQEMQVSVTQNSDENGSNRVIVIHDNDGVLNKKAGEQKVNVYLNGEKVEELDKVQSKDITTVNMKKNEDGSLSANITTNSKEDSSKVMVMKAAEKPAKESKPVANSVEVMPRFQGGDMNTFPFYIAQQLKYTPDMQGRVLAQFVVAEDGSVRDLEFIGNDGSEALRNAISKIILNSPQWTPGTKDGKPTAVKMTIPFTCAVKK